MVGVVEAVVVDCQDSVLVVLELQVEVFLLLLQQAVGGDVEVVVVESVVVGAVCVVLALILGLAREQQDYLINDISEEPAVLLCCDEVRIDSRKDAHVLLSLVLDVDVLLYGRRALLWVEEGEHLRVYCFDSPPCVQVVLDVLQPVEGFSEAILVSGNDASVFCEDHEERHIVNDVLALLRLDLGGEVVPEVVKALGRCLADELLVVVLSNDLHLEAALPREVLVVFVVQLGKQVPVLFGTVQPEGLLHLKRASDSLPIWSLLHWFDYLSRVLLDTLLLFLWLCCLWLFFCCLWLNPALAGHLRYNLLLSAFARLKCQIAGYPYRNHHDYNN